MNLGEEFIKFLHVIHDGQVVVSSKTQFEGEGLNQNNSFL